MSDMKCPFCQQELRSVIQQEGENTHTTWHCPKCELEKYKWACGNKTLWQALIDTRKALEIAVDALGYYASENSWDETDRWMFVDKGFEGAKDALEQITALEQKGK